MEKLLILLPFFLLLLILSFLFARMGWKQLERDFLAVKKSFPDLKRIGYSTMIINEVTYSSSVVIYVAKEGLFLKPTFFLKPTHNSLFIPWHVIRERTHIKSNSYRSYMIGDRFVSISLPLKICLAIEKKANITL